MSVRATVTLPGVIVLEGDVSDDEAKAVAERYVRGVAGVQRVINALTTESLQWLLVQNRINQALQRNGFSLVSVKISDKSAEITGRVSNVEEKKRALTLISSTAPDVSIGINQITVGSTDF
jgi:osmotically-inducible protein OsmY